MDSKTAKANENRLKILLEWKKLYTEAIIDSLKPTGNVLQIGFGLGFAADLIQKYHPKTHTIIESNPKISANATKWSGKNKNITFIQGSWKTALPKLGTFDTLFFNDYPPEQEVEIMNFLFPEDVLQASKEAQKMLSSLKDEMSQLTRRFTDKDIEDFYQKSGQFNLKDLPLFFQQLKDNGNISKTQYENSLKKYHFNDPQKSAKNLKQNTPKAKDVMLFCLEDCLKNHMDAGSRFSSFLINQMSKYEDAQFFDNIITNTDVNYNETAAIIKMSDKTRQGLIISIEKQ